MTTRTLRLALALAGIAAGASIAAVLLLEGHGEFAAPAVIPLWLAIGWSFLASGLVAWARRPDNRTGPLMVAVTFAWFAAGLTYVDRSVPFTIGLAVQALYIVICGHLLLAFPTGRLHAPLARTIVIVAYVDVVLVNVLWLLFAAEGGSCDPCPPNAALVFDAPRVADGIVNAERGIGALCSLAAVAIVAVRLRGGSAPWRRSVAPVLKAGGLAFGLLVLSLVNASLGEPLGNGPQWAFWIAFLVVPIAFLAGLLRTRLARAGVADLVLRLRTGDATGVRDAIAAALGDPDVELGFWLSDQQRYVDADGRPLPGEPRPGRATRIVELDGRRIAVVVHDAALVHEPELVDAVVAAATLALENARLAAELRARLDELRRERDFISAVLDTAPTLVCALTPDGRILSFNTACERVSGCRSEDVIGRRIWEVVIPQEQASGVERALRQAGARSVPVEHENDWVGRDGSRRRIAWLNTAILGEDGEVEHLVCAGLDVTERRRQEEELIALHGELEQRLEELRASRARIVEAEDGARRRIERNLHDGAQQRLVSVSMALGLAESRLDAEPAGARELLREARESLTTALEELREISQGIHPAILTERGLATALRELAYRTPMTIDLDVSEERLPEPVEAAAYYVVAEALANVGKHAGASSVHVSVERTNGRARVAVADDGVGGADLVSGTGLRGLADRVEALGGTLSVASPPGHGTRIEVEIPCAS